MPEIIISTDILGMFGKIQDLEKLYGSRFRKLELIGWGLTLDRHLKEAKNNGYEISSIHGQLTSRAASDPILQKAYLSFIDLILKPTPTLISYGKTTNLLFHDANLNKNNQKALVNNKNNLKQIWVENHYPGTSGIDYSLRIINALRDTGISTGLTFDFAHFIDDANLLGNNFAHYWNQTLKFIENKLLNLEIPVSFHFPVGTTYDDSLPVEDKLTVEMLRDFTALLKIGKFNRFIIENQQAGIIDHLYLHPNKFKKVRKRNDMIMEKLTKVGII